MLTKQQILWAFENLTIGKTCKGLLTIDLCIEKWPAILVTFMSWDIPKLNKEIPFCITFYTIWRAPRTSISYVLEKRLIHYKNHTYWQSTFQDKVSYITFTPTAQPIVCGGREMEEPLTIRCTKEVLPTPVQMKKEAYTKYSTCKI